MSEWHLITGEYPPQPGGVADYTRLVASGLAAAGDVVHVWCPQSGGPHPEDAGVIVHRELGAMTPDDLRKAGRMLDEFPGPRRLLVQWVPHAFGFRSANLPMALWIWSRAFAHRDCVEVMIHEPCLPMPQDRLRHAALAIVHRMMLTVVLAAATRVWLAIQKWEERCRPYSFFRRVRFSWLPVPSNISVHNEDSVRQAVRTRYAAGCKFLIGHFGTCGGAIGDVLRAVIPELLDHDSGHAVLLIGHDSEQLRLQLLERCPPFRDRLHSTGSISAREASLHISACDVMVQPYPDGASSRRGGLMAALSHGKPIVTTEGSLTESLWRESNAVVLAAAGNQPEIVKAVNQILASDGERNRLSAAAAITYERHFALANTIRALRNSVADDDCIPIPHLRRA